jgi:membrane protease YdiL (CAAX protease family)
MSGMKTTSVIIGKILLLAVMVFALMVIAMIPILVIAASMNAGLSIEELIETPFMKNSMMFVQTICVIGAVILMYISFERKSGLSLGWKQKQPIRAAIVGSNWGIALMSGLFLGIWAFGGLQVMDVQFDRAVIGSLVFGLILFGLVAINEELLCRGYIQGMLRRHMGPFLAIAITSLLFTSLHLMNDNVMDSPIPLINLFLAGVLLGVSREVTGGLWVPIGIHFTWNYFQGYIYGFEVSGNIIEDSLITIEAQGNELLSGGSFGAEGSLLATVILIVFIYVFWSRRKRELSIAEVASAEVV